MILKVFTVYDSKAEAYLPPFFMQSKGQAVRAFTDSIADADHQFAKHPEDYTLFELGEYDDSTGKFKCSAPVAIGNAIEFKKVA